LLRAQTPHLGRHQARHEQGDLQHRRSHLSGRWGRGASAI
jgi:hypothetical protein